MQIKYQNRVKKINGHGITDWTCDRFFLHTTQTLVDTLLE